MSRQLIAGLALLGLVASLYGCDETEAVGVSGAGRRDAGGGDNGESRRWEGDGFKIIKKGNYGMHPDKGDGTDAGMDMEDASMPPPSNANCKGSANAMHFDSEMGDYIGGGDTFTVTNGVFGSVGEKVAAPSTVEISVAPADNQQGSNWRLVFLSSKLMSPLDTKKYEMAMRHPFEDDNTPGLSVTGSGRGCNTISGEFEVLSLSMDGTDVKTFAATFEQYCGTSDKALRGCVAYSKPTM